LATPTPTGEKIIPTPNPTAAGNVILANSAISDAVFGLAVFLTFAAIAC
jgi:hypothetical protein